MRLYLDTNVLVFLVTKDRDEVDDNTWELLTDPANTLYTSTACVHEFTYLVQSGRVRLGREQQKGMTVVWHVRDAGIRIQPVTEKNLEEEEQLPLLDDRCDPTDRLIMAQAISDKATLVSSDLEFPNYVEYGLLLHRNIRRARGRKKKG